MSVSDRIVILGRYVDRLGVYGTATEPVDMLTARQHMINVSAVLSDAPHFHS